MTIPDSLACDFCRREALSADDLTAVLAAGSRTVEFLLLGIGPKTSPAPAEVRNALRAAGMGLEVMDTATACRLYNVLAAEGRKVVHWWSAMTWWRQVPAAMCSALRWVMRAGRNGWRRRQ